MQKRKRLYKGTYFNFVKTNKTMFDTFVPSKKYDDESKKNEKGIEAMNGASTRDNIEISKSKFYKPFFPTTSIDYFAGKFDGILVSSVKNEYSYIELEITEKGKSLDDAAGFGFEFYYQKALNLCKMHNFNYEFVIIEGVVYGLAERFMSKGKLVKVGYKEMVIDNSESKKCKSDAKQKTGRDVMMKMTDKIINGLK